MCTVKPSWAFKSDTIVLQTAPQRRSDMVELYKMVRSSLIGFRIYLSRLAHGTFITEGNPSLKSRFKAGSRHRKC